MKRMFWAFLLLGLVAACGEEDSDTITLYAAVDQLVVRAEPNPDLEPIAKLSELESVEFLGIYSPLQYTFTLRGTEFTTNFLQVRLSDGTVGWVFAGGVLPSQSSMEYVETVDEGVNLILFTYSNPLQYFGDTTGLSGSQEWLVVEETESGFKTYYSDLDGVEKTETFYPYDMPTELDFTEVTVPGAQMVWFAVFGLDLPTGNLPEDVVSTGAYDDVSPYKWEYNGSEYAFYYVDENDDPDYADIKVYWEADGETQLIYENSDYDVYWGVEVYPLWTGDLDQDGELDLLGNFMIENNGGKFLYLSSLAKGKDALGSAAEAPYAGYW